MLHEVCEKCLTLLVSHRILRVIAKPDIVRTHIIISSKYSLSDLGVSSNLIGLLSQCNLALFPNGVNNA